jgi:O-antigen/teichoic acid export membrane protein
MSVKKSILKNGIAAAFQKGIKVAEQLFLVPFFIQFWGAAYYGEWLTLTVVPSVFALSDFGFGSAVANTFLLKYAGGDKQGAADIAKTGILIITCLIVSAILLSLVGVIALYHYGVFSKSLINSRDAVFSVIILLIARIINFYQALFEAYFRAARKANISIHFQSLLALINIVAGIIVLWSGGKVVEYALSILVIVIVVNPLYIYIAHRILGLHHTHQGSIDKDLIKPLIRKGMGYFLSPIWQAIYFQGMTFVVRLVLGPIAVTIFNTVRTLVRSSSQAFAMSITATYPDFQFEMGSGNIKKAKSIFLGVLTINILMSIVFVIGLSLFGDLLYNWWTKNSLQVLQEVWLLFIAGIFFYALWFTFSFIFEAANKPYTTTFAGTLCSLFSVGVSWLLCQHIGLIGAAAGCLIFDIVMSTYLIGKAMKALQITLRDILTAFPNLLQKQLRFKNI